MRRWTYALGGLLAWTAHFLGIYACASLAAQTPAADTGLWQALALAISAVCAAACLLLLAIAGRRLRRRLDGTTRLMDRLAALGAALGLVAIAWQTASVVIV